MGLVAEYDINCEALPLVGVAAAAPDATVVLSLQFAHGEVPQFVATVTGGSHDAIETALDDARDVETWTLVGEAGDTRRYTAHPALTLGEQLGEAVDDLGDLRALARADAVVERIAVQPEGWRQTGWFADRDVLERFASVWQPDPGFRLRRATRDGEPEPPGDGLTDPQREALRTAYELGYFAVPRQASLADVADHLDVSASSASERLRRAQTTLVEETVATTWPPLPE